MFRIYYNLKINKNLMICMLKLTISLENNLKFNNN